MTSTSEQHSANLFGMGRLITRRRFFAGVGATLAGTLLYANRIEPHRVTIVSRELPIANLPKDLNGKILVQISDLHIGPTGDDYLRSCFRLVEGLNPLLIVITGDFVTGRGSEEIAHVGSLISELKTPPLGIVGTFGNHDYGPTWAQAPIADKLAETLRDCGLKVLRNQLIDVSGMQIVGMDEVWAGKFLPQAAFEDYDSERAGIALSHNPDTLDRPGWGDYRGWVLCGHTHGGQCKLPFFRPPFLPVENPRYTSGEIDVGEGRRIYINRGLGYARRVRFNARPEITAFTLRLAEN